MPTRALAIWRPNPPRAPMERHRPDRFQLEILEPRYHFSAAQIDPTFGESGHAYVSGPPNTVQWGTWLATQSDGAILLVGRANEVDQPGQGTSFLSRLRPDGTADPDFHPFKKPTSLFQQVLPQPDGKILVMTDDGLIRLNPDGQLDPTFSCEPITPWPGEHPFHWFDDVALLPDGRIVAVVACDGDSGSIFMVERFNPDGSPDLSFGQGGAVVPVPDDQNLFTARPTPDGHLLLITGNGDGSEYDLWRLNPDGSLDPTFGQAGRAILPEMPWAADFFRIPQNPLVVQPNGSILIGLTEIQHFSDYDLWLDDLARLTPDGQLDPTFGNAGLLDLPDEPQSIDLLPHDDGKLDVVLKYYDDPGTPRGAVGLLRLNPDFTPDTTFAPDGILRINNSTTGDAQVALQGHDIIVLVNDTDTDEDHLDPTRFFHLVRIADAPAASPEDHATFPAAPRPTSDATRALSPTPIFDDDSDELNWDVTDPLWS